MNTAVADARPDDRRSWWTTVDGRDVCNRVNYLNSPIGAGGRSRDLMSGFVGYCRTGWNDLRRCLRSSRREQRGHQGAGGLADLPWHRDCGMGGHPVKCPMLNVGIQLEPGHTRRRVSCS